jgi:tetratricopeptide (TPR) repeat protein
MMRGSRLGGGGLAALAGLVFFLRFIPLSAQEGPLPPEWFFYQQSLGAFRADNFGEALRQLKNLEEAYGPNADTLHLRARIYEQEGEADLAEKYYLAALERGDFGIPDDKYAVSYGLANMYYQRKSYKKYEDVLAAVAQEQALYTQPRYARMRDSYVSVLLRQGFDALAVLYRVPFDFAQEAHRDLGVFYCRTGREMQALLHLAFANLAVVSELADELKRFDPDYTFTTLEDAFERIQRRAELQDFLARSDFYRSLYFLATVLYSQGAAREARMLWELVAKHGSGVWKTQSRNQLIDPKAEPLITY